MFIERKELTIAKLKKNEEKERERMHNEGKTVAANERNTEKTPN